jgi:hypothetical protein
MLLLMFVSTALFGLERLEPDYGCYLGAYLGVDRPDEEVATPVDTFVAKAGKEHAIYHRFMSYETPFPRAWADSVEARGSACLISWGMPDSLAMDSCYNFQDPVFMRFVSEMEDFGGPVFVRLGWEMNGCWYSWGQCFRHYVPAFKRAARIIHDSCPKAAMVWCPNYGGGYPWSDIGGHSEGDAYTVYYPADDSFHYVDWVGLDFYHNEYWNNTYTPLAAILGKPDSSLVHFYNHYCDTLGKPFLFGETSTLELSRGNQNGTLQRWWIRTLYDSANLNQNWPKLKAINWFHVLKKEWMGGIYDWVDWRITDTNFTVYRQVISSSYFLSHPDTGGVVENDERSSQARAGVFRARPIPGGILVECQLAPNEQALIAVYDIGGRLVASAPIQANSVGRATLSFSDNQLGAKSGIRFLVLKSRSGFRALKLAIAR